MNRYRLMVYSVLGVVTPGVYALIQSVGGIDRAGFPLLVAISTLGGICVVLFVVDVVYHAWRGNGYACPHCGHHRKMDSFRLYSACPECGK